MRNFKVGEIVVHTTHGVGTIKSIESRQFGENTSTFYIIEIPDNGAPKKCFVPVDSVNGRLRPVSDANALVEVQKYLEAGQSDAGRDQTWNRRYREYMELVQSGDVFNIAKVYLSLRTLQSEGDLSFGERKLLEMAASRLNNEFEAAGIPLKL